MTVPSRGPGRFRAPTWALAAVGTLALTAALVAGLVALAGYDASDALAALWRGSVGSPYALLSSTLVSATPLLLAGLAVAIAFRAGVLNIGAEGQLLAGAAACAAVGVLAGPALGGVAPLAMLVAGAAAGGLWAGIAAVLRRRFGVLDVIGTLMLNFVALHVVSYLVRGPLQEPSRIYPQTPSLAESARLPQLVEGTRLHWGFPLALVAAAAAWWIVRETAAGFRLRVVGANPRAARSAGLIDVERTVTLAFLWSGALAGLAGAAEVAGVTFALYENLSPGWGYTAIAVALLARLHPLAVVPSAVLFGALEAGAAAMQRDAGVPSVLVSVVEATLILVVLGVGALAARRRARGASAEAGRGGAAGASAGGGAEPAPGRRRADGAPDFTMGFSADGSVTESVRDVARSLGGPPPERNIVPKSRLAIIGTLRAVDHSLAPRPEPR